MRVLFLSNWYPYPPDNGSKIRIYNLIKGLAQEHEVTLISFMDPSFGTPDNHMESICEAVYTFPRREYNATSASAILGLFDRRPRVLVDRYVPEINDRIQEEIDLGSQDVIIASQMYMAAYLDQLRTIPAIFEEVEIGLFEDAVTSSTTPISRFRHQLTLTKMGAYYERLLSHYAACTVVSEMEKKRLKKLIPGYHRIEVIPNGVDLGSYKGFHSNPNPKQLIFTGSFTYRPNFEAMEWFTSQVYPQVLAQIPDVKLIITGISSNKQLSNSKQISLAGYVEDVRSLIASSWLSLVPIFTGGGTRLKILEAFALKTPVIATSKGAEGLEALHEEHLLIADTPEDYTRQTVRLLQNEELRERLVKNAYKLVKEKYDWTVIMPKFLRLVQKAANSPLN